MSLLKLLLVGVLLSLSGGAHANDENCRWTLRVSSPPQFPGSDKLDLALMRRFTAAEHAHQPLEEVPVEAIMELRDRQEFDALKLILGAESCYLANTSIPIVVFTSNLLALKNALEQIKSILRVQIDRPFPPPKVL